MDQLKVFISYSSEDRFLGRVFKQSFENYAGFSVFLAHEDISPATEWELKIIKEMKNSDVVIPLITKNYRNSEFTDQELGMALAWEKIILPIKLADINPYGFIKKFQALKCKNDEYSVINGVVSTVLVLIESKEFNKHRNVVIESVVKAFCQSSSFKMTRTIIGILTKINKFTDDQITSFKKAIKNNDQIYKEYYALPGFKKILREQHKIIIDS